MEDAVEWSLVREHVQIIRPVMVSVSNIHICAENYSSRMGEFVDLQPVLH